ncbi:MAG: excinuclease ABC subunit UvrB [Candidatus Paceibacterota bacterium]|jgi:excinuclease ABC subunit B
MNKNKFELISKFEPRGDQPKAIKELVSSIKSGNQFQTLLGVTGSGKTFTMANVIQKIQRPTLVVSPNKTLCAQLYEEFKAFFPNNAVSYFVSYYDYYQPESYLPQTDTYINKDAKINQEIDRMRHEAVQSLIGRKDVLVVASVSCIYGLGSPETYQKFSLIFKKGQELSHDELIGQLLNLQYARNDYELWRGNFRVRGAFIDVWTLGKDQILRFEIESGKIKNLWIGEVPLGAFTPQNQLEVWPAKFWISEKEKIKASLKDIEEELKEQTEKLKDGKKLLEAERLQRRTEYDMAMLRETGWCHGIENYSRYFEKRPKGEPPYTLMDYFPKDHLLFLDESHMTIPQVRGMNEGDRSRKKTLIDYGFRLPSALDNRPLKFDEFMGKTGTTIFVSATPNIFERQHSAKIAEQIIRPTYLLDPEIEIKPSENQIKDLMAEIAKRKEKDQRVLVLTLTKKMAEALSQYFKETKIKAEYIHSEVKTLERPKILANLRKGKFDVLVGINLLREGLDLPEVSLIAILDADKEGFLRDETSLIQIMGRASRHPEGKIIMYADNITGSMKRAISETTKRRKIQKAYNKAHKVDPASIITSIKDSLSGMGKKDEEEGKEHLPNKEFLKEHLKRLSLMLDMARRNLQFEKAAEIKEEIENLKKNLD